MSVHKIAGIGNLTRTPELRFLQSGTAVTTVTVAVNDSYQRDGEEVKKVTYWDCEFFGAQAERVAERNYEKGFKVYFEGRPEVSTWEDKDGNVRVRCKVRFPTVEKIAGKTAEGDYHAAPEEEPVRTRANGKPRVDDEEEIVF